MAPLGEPNGVECWYHEVKLFLALAAERQAVRRRDDMLQDEIREVEEQLVTPAVRAPADALDRLVSDEFVEFAGRVYNKQDVIAKCWQRRASPIISES